MPDKYTNNTLGSDQERFEEEYFDRNVFSLNLTSDFFCHSKQIVKDFWERMVGPESDRLGGVIGGLDKQRKLLNYIYNDAYLNNYYTVFSAFLVHEITYDQLKSRSKDFTVARELFDCLISPDNISQKQDFANACIMKYFVEYCKSIKDQGNDKKGGYTVNHHLNEAIPASP